MTCRCRCWRVYLQCLPAGHDDEVSRLKDELESAKKKIASASDAKAGIRRQMMEKQLSKLGSPDNIAASLEGIVFEHPPGSKALYKLTGGLCTSQPDHRGRNTHS